MNSNILNILLLEVDEIELLRRAKYRALDSIRADDNDAEVQIKRINIFKEKTNPMIEFLRSKYEISTIDGCGTTREVFDRIKLTF